MTNGYFASLTSREVQQCDAAVKTLAGKLLDPFERAELLLGPPRTDDFKNALGALLNVVAERRRFIVKDEGKGEDYLERLTDVDARTAFSMLIEYFGTECVCALAYDEANRAA